MSGIRSKRAIEQLSNRASADKARREFIQLSQARMAEIDTQMQRLNAEVKSIEVDDVASLDYLRSERMDAYLEYFDTLNDEAEVLERLYRPVKEYLMRGKENEQSLEVSIRRQVNVDAWLDRGEAIVNQRVQLNFGPMKTFEDFRTFGKEVLGEAWKSGDRKTIKDAFDMLLKHIRSRPGTATTYLRKSRTMWDFVTWLYEFSHLNLSYSISYQKTPLESLSPGTKGIVLLILYLGMVTNDRRPLIVDQPEENLDNKSIFSDLAGYFRKSKQKRQVIIITHNPNLVVNTDAEQIVVAECTRRENGLPAMTYVSGSMENATPAEPDIRGRICRILEGGEPAFRKREDRYSLRRQ